MRASSSASRASPQAVTFIVTLQPNPGIDGLRALRMLLRVGLRRFGLRCIDVREEHPHD